MSCRGVAQDVPKDIQSDETPDEPALPQAPTSVAESSGEPESSTVSPGRSERIKVRSGDSLYALFLARKVSTRDLATLLKSGSGSASLKRLRPGQSLELEVEEDNSLAGLKHHLDAETTIEFWRKPSGGYEHREIHHPLEARTVTGSGVIDSSLFLAGKRSGLSHNVIMQMVEIFGWDVDFALDIRSGDRFSVIYEEL